MNKTLEKVESFIIYATVFLFPFLVLPLSPTNPHVVTRLTVLVAGIVLALLARSIRIIVSGELELKRGNFDIPILVLGISVIVPWARYIILYLNKNFAVVIYQIMYLIPFVATLLVRLYMPTLPE